MTWLAFSFPFHGLCIESFFPLYEFLNQTSEVPFAFVLNEVARLPLCIAESRLASPERKLGASGCSL
jgi:hypothetical protein